MKERGVWREAQVCVTGKRRKQLSDEHRLLWLFDIGLSAVSFLCGGNTVIKQGGQQVSQRHSDSSKVRRETHILRSAEMLSVS